MLTYFQWGPRNILKWILCRNLTLMYSILYQNTTRTCQENSFEKVVRKWQFCSSPQCIHFDIKYTYMHYDDVIMGAMASQITSFTIVYSTVYSGADQRKHQSSASLAFEWWIHRGPVDSPHKLPVTRKCFHSMTSSCILFDSRKSSSRPQSQETFRGVWGSSSGHLDRKNHATRKCSCALRPETNRTTAARRLADNGTSRKSVRQHGMLGRRTGSYIIRETTKENIEPATHRVHE